MNGWIQTYNDESEKQKRKTTSKPVRFSEHFNLHSFQTRWNLLSKKAQRKNVIGKTYLVKKVQELNPLLFRIHPLTFGHHIIFSSLQLIIAHVFSRFFNGSQIFGIFITFVRLATIQLVPLRDKSKYDCWRNLGMTAKRINCRAFTCNTS